MKGSVGRKLLLLGSAVAGLVGAMPAQALNIVLRPDASFAASPNGQAALLGFSKAANYWNSVITTDVTLNFAISFGPLDEGVLGGALSNGLDTTTRSVYDALKANQSSALDATAVANLRPLSAANGLGMRIPGTQTIAYDDPTTAAVERTPTPVLSTTVPSVYDNNDSYNNRYLFTNTAINRALGLAVDPGETLFQAINDFYGQRVYDPKHDASITFSSTFDFDYDPSNGIGVGQYDFVGVAVHEMGHALGFVSGTDDYDYYALPAGPGAPLPAADADGTAFASALDLFRYATNGFVPGTSDRALQLDPGREAFFSIDGRRPFNFNDNLGDASSSFFATGSYNGDGNQASHWKDSLALLDPNGCVVDARQVGIMDPTAANCTKGVVTSNDLAAFDAMGYNLNVDVLTNRGYRFDTAQIAALAGFAAVPEPTSWAMMLAGFGLAGAALRRRRVRVAFA